MARKAWRVQLQESHSVILAISCAIIGLSRCPDHDPPKLADDAVMILVLSAITDRH
ncbi:MAG: hypothetical protein J6568_04995 [Snodgrassella sp.]|jgi:putative transposase|nr:hypothetical protein [Snodgrassella sp.]